MMHMRTVGHTSPVARFVFLVVLTLEALVIPWCTVTGNAASLSHRSDSMLSFCIHSVNHTEKAWRHVQEFCFQGANAQNTTAATAALSNVVRNLRILAI